MNPCREAKTSKRVAGCASRAQAATTWQRRALLARAVALVALLVTTSTASADVLIRGARLIDATGAPPREAVDVLVIGKRVAAIGDELAAGGIPVLDASGLTLLPGLIDSHVHLAAAPGSALRGDTSADIHALNRVHLRAFLASGITTILDPGFPFEMVENVQAHLAAGAPGPRYLTTGPIVRVPGGYGDDAHGSVESAEDVEVLFDRIRAMGGVGVKLATETALGPFRTLPTYGPELARAISNAAEERELPLYVHAMNEPDADRALELGAHAIVHAPMGGAWRGDFFGVDDLSDRYVERLRASGAYQLTTFSLLDTWPGGFDRSRLDDPRGRLVVPARELATAHSPDVFERFAVASLGYAMPWLPDTLRAPDRAQRPCARRVGTPPLGEESDTGSESTSRRPERRSRPPPASEALRLPVARSRPAPEGLLPAGSASRTTGGRESAPCRATPPRLRSRLRPFQPDAPRGSCQIGPYRTSSPRCSS